MSKDENAGLLSKVVKFVKNPTTSWSDLDLQEPDRESGYSKQMLKEMIERKRRNDFVRKREFDMLRKLRRSEVMAGHDPGARPSFFQSSMPSKPDDRATTLKKIDEIEAQMSMQWWKTKHGDVSSRAGSSTNFPVSSHMPPDVSSGTSGASPLRSTAYTRTEPQPLEPARATTEETQEAAPMLASVTPVALQAPATPPAAPPTPKSAPGPASRGATPLPRGPAAPSISAVTTMGPTSDGTSSSN